MNALQIEGVVAPKKPIVGTLPCCCAHAGYGLTTGASAALHSNATNARRRKPLVGAVRSLGATNWVSQPRTPSSLRAAFGRRPSRVGRLFEHLARRHPDHLRATTDSPWYGDAKRGRGVLVPHAESCPRDRPRGETSPGSPVRRTSALPSRR